MIRKLQNIALLSGVLLFLAFGMSSCMFFSSWKFHEQYEDEQGFVEVWREGESQPVFLWLDYAWPGGEAPVIQETALNRTELHLSFTDLESGEELLAEIDSTGYHSLEILFRRPDTDPDQVFLSGMNNSGRIQHGMVLYPPMEEKAVWRKCNLKISLIPYAFREEIIPGNRQKVTKIRSSAPLLEWDLPLELFL